MPDTFKTSELIEYFGNRREVTQNELHDFYRQFEPDLNRDTLRWRIYKLKEKGVLTSIGKGRYTFHSRQEWVPELSEDEKELFQSVQNQFPYVESCIWSTRWLLSFTKHMPVQYITLIETERDTETPVFNYLKDSITAFPVFLNPDRKEIDTYFSWNQNNIVIKTLISQAPLREWDGVRIPKLEKILVDLFADDLFQAFKGQELITIYRNVFTAYQLNISTLKRYSTRRNKWDELRSLLENNINQPILYEP
jgi:hypothetical protein